MLALSRLVTAAVAVVTLAWPTFAQNAQVVVVHGVPGVTVDVFVNTNLALPDFEPFTVTDEITLPAGQVDVVIAAAGAGIGMPVASLSASLDPNSFTTIVAHLDANSQVVLSAFANDAASDASKSGVLTVRHTAAAPAVDLVVRSVEKKKELASAQGLTNGQELSIALKNGGLFEVEVLPSGSNSPVFGPATVYISEGSALVLYAVGSVTGATFSVLQQSYVVSTVARVEVVHGIPGVPVDVYVDGLLALSAFQPLTSTGSLDFEPGTHAVALTSVGGSIGMPILAGDFYFARGRATSLVACLDAGANPQVLSFLEDLSAISARQARCIVRHCAQAPAVTATFFNGKVDKATLVSQPTTITNGEQGDLVAAKRGVLVVSAAGSSLALLPPAELRLDSKGATVVYIFGSLPGETVETFVQVVQPD